MQKSRAPAVGGVEVNRGTFHLHTQPPGEPACRAAKPGAADCAVSQEDRTTYFRFGKTWLILGQFIISCVLCVLVHSSSNFS